jgi:predicted transposase YdaD
VVQFRKLSRKELEAPLQVSDVRETRVFQEALEEGEEKGHKKGIKEGIEKGIEKGVEQVAMRMLQLDRTPAEIAAATGLGVAHIRKLNKKLAEG